VNGKTCGIVPRAIGGSFAVLVAEQLLASGARVIVGLTSAGRVSPKLQIPGLVVPTAVIRDKGTSFHYLPASRSLAAPPDRSNRWRVN
jgi:uridine phosphorylase